VNVARSSSATGTTGTAEAAGRYCGRFAPSPTGPLHFGSLLAAVGSYLEARTRQGRWLLRIEDLDPPRERPGAVEQIISDLDRFGFEWDGPIVRQSARAREYDAALDRLTQLGLTLDCGCSRSQLAALGGGSQEQGDELFHPAICPNPVAAGTGATPSAWVASTASHAPAARAISGACRVTLVEPPITTVHVPLYELGTLGMRLALDLLAGAPRPRRKELPLALVVRATTGVPRSRRPLITRRSSP